MEDLIKQEIKRTMIKHLKEAFSTYGIEGTEDKIKEIYCNMDTVREQYLAVYWELIKSNGN